MAATGGLMAGTQIFRDDESSILYANSLLQKFPLGLMLTMHFLMKLPKRIVDYDCPCSDRPSSCRFTGSDLFHLQSPKEIRPSVEKNFSHSLTWIGEPYRQLETFLSLILLLCSTLWRKALIALNDVMIYFNDLQLTQKNTK